MQVKLVILYITNTSKMIFFIKKYMYLFILKEYNKVLLFFYQY